MRATVAPTTEPVPPTSAYICLRQVPVHTEGIFAKRKHLATIYRWERHGDHGVRLRTACSGAGEMVTTDRWLSEFFVAVAAAKEAARGTAKTPAAPATPVRRRKAGAR